MASDMWSRTIHIAREEMSRRHYMGYSFRLAERVLLYTPSHMQDSTYHSNVTSVAEKWLERQIAQWVHPMKDRSDDPSHHERTLLPRSYISLPSRKKDAYFNISIVVPSNEPMGSAPWNTCPWIFVVLLTYVLNAFRSRTMI